MRNSLLTIITSSLLIMAFTVAPEAEKEKKREKLGGRVGYAATTSSLDDAFGAGFAAVLHFTENFKPPLGVDFSFGTIYLGKTSREDITRRTFLSSHKALMNVVYFAASPQIELGHLGKTSIFVSGGVGLYAVTLILDSGFFSGSNSQYHFGLNGGAALAYRLSSNWAAELALIGHKFWTSDDRDDWFWIYSEGDKHPFFYQVTVGVTLALR